MSWLLWGSESIWADHWSWRLFRSWRYLASITWPLRNQVFLRDVQVHLLAHILVALASAAVSIFQAFSSGPLWDFYSQEPDSKKSLGVGLATAYAGLGAGGLATIFQLICLLCMRSNNRGEDGMPLLSKETMSSWES